MYTDMGVFHIFLALSTFMNLWLQSNALYFHIGETEKKCFLEEVPEETMLMGKYKIEYVDPQTRQIVPPTKSIAMHVVVSNPNAEQVLSRTYGSEGMFTFTSHAAGEHSICLHSNSTAWFGGGKLRVHLDIQVGEHALDYKKIASTEKLSELELRVRQLLDQVDQIQKEQNYQRYREERFRETSDSTNQRVLYWSLGQVAILVVIGFWQLSHLKSFFQAKKLV